VEESNSQQPDGHLSDISLRHQSLTHALISSLAGRLGAVFQNGAMGGLCCSLLAVLVLSDTERTSGSGGSQMLDDSQSIRPLPVCLEKQGGVLFHLARFFSMYFRANSFKCGLFCKPTFLASSSAASMLMPSLSARRIIQNAPTLIAAVQ
jgi:hypothetical protein